MKAQLKPSLAGFNTSRRADRSNVEAFLKSYLKAFPKRKLDLEVEWAELAPWLEKLLAKPRP